jgi:hypothetical protein
VKDESRPAGWYDDPTDVGELRYYDGQQWTAHVTIEGVQTMVAYEVAAVDTNPGYTVARVAQPRSEEERPLDVVGDVIGPMGRFVTVVEGAPGYRFEDVDGDVVLSVFKPGLKSEVEVHGPTGNPVGVITKVGRLRSRYDIVRAGSGETIVGKLRAGSEDQWEVQAGAAMIATVTRAVGSPADPSNYVAVTYSVNVPVDVEPDLDRLLLAIPITIDMLDTQALA